MKNLIALSFVTLFLSACWSYTWTHTNPDLVARDRFSSEQRADYLRSGGAFRGLD